MLPAEIKRSILEKAPDGGVTLQAGTKEPFVVWLFQHVNPPPSIALIGCPGNRLAYSRNGLSGAKAGAVDFAKMVAQMLAKANPDKRINTNRR